MVYGKRLRRLEIILKTVTNPKNLKVTYYQNGIYYNDKWEVIEKPVDSEDISNIIIEFV